MSRSSEIILTEESNRFTLFPIKYSRMYQFFQDHEANFWTAEEIDLKEDVKHWKNVLNDNEKYFIKHVLAFFAASDGIVNENLVLNFYKKIPVAEARAFYTFQMAMETIHSQVYSILIDTYIKDTTEKKHLFDAIDTVPVVAKKAQWALKWLNLEEEMTKKLLDEYTREPSVEKAQQLAHYMSSTKDNFQSNFVKQLLAFIIVEGLFFSGSFCAIFWLKNRGLMPGLSFANELISKDEAMHCDFGIHLYSLISPENKLSNKEVYQMIDEAVQIEEEFITESLPVSLIGMNSKSMKEYIRFVADKILLNLGCPKLYNTDNPFTFMELLSFSGNNSKVNFFEKRNPDYQKSGVGRSEEELQLTFDEEF